MAAARKKVTTHKKTTHHTAKVVEKLEKKIEDDPQTETSIPMQQAPLSSPVPPSEAQQPQQQSSSPQPQTPPTHPVQQTPPAPAPSLSPSSDPLANFKEKLQEDSSTPIPLQKKNFLIPILFVVLLAFVMLGGAFLYKQSVDKKTENINVVSLSPSPTSVPTPTVEEVDLTAYEIKILNGSETAGEAGRQQENLEGEGFTVSEVGNAEESDYTETIIQAKEDVEKAFLDELKEVLEKSFKVAKDVEELPEDADSDAIVIIGSETN